MIKEAIATGENVEAAFASACRQLGVETIDASCDVLELPQKKTLGLFGGRPAKVRAYIEVPDEVKPAPAEEKPVVKPVEKSKPEPVKPAESENVSVPAPADLDAEPAEKAAEYVKTILSYMGLPGANVDIQPNESGAALVLSGEDVGFVIGHRGETLDALQYLASLVANHTDGAYFRLTLDVGNYREKRKDTLEALGRKMAYRAVKTGRNASLEPMNPYEAANGISPETITGAAAAITAARAAMTAGTAAGRRKISSAVPLQGPRVQSRTIRALRFMGRSKLKSDRGRDGGGCPAF